MKSQTLTSFRILKFRTSSYRLGTSRYKKHGGVLEEWIADWKAAGGTESDALRAIQEAVHAYWKAFGTTEAQDIHTVVAWRV